MADHRFTIDGTTLVRRLRSLYSHWRGHRDELWGSCNAFAVATPPRDDNIIRYFKSLTLSIWLLGYEFPETIMVFSDKQIHFLCSQTLASLLELDDIFKKSAKEAVDVDHVVMHVKSNHDDEITTQMDDILHDIEEKSNGNDDIDYLPVLGYIAGEAPEGELLKNWNYKIYWSLQLCDITNGLADLFTVKEDVELRNVKKAGYFSASAMKRFVAPKLEKVIKEGKKVTHLSLSDETEGAILEPATFNVKLKADHVDICCPPIFQSGWNFNLRPSTTSEETCLCYNSGSVIRCQLGSRYKSYCTNVARTFLIDPDATQIKAYWVLLEAHEAAVGALKPGNKANAVYKAAYAVVEKLAPELIPNFTKSAGGGIGLEYYESGLDLNKKNRRILKAGMVLNVSLGFQHMETKSSHKYALLISDTVIITPSSHKVVTWLSSKAFKDVAYTFNDKTPQLKAEAAKRTEYFKAATLRSSDNHEPPFLPATLSEIEIVNLERVGVGQKNFDMVYVFKDLKRDVFQMPSIPSTLLDGIKEWLDTMDIKYYESRQNLNWRAILKTITDDPQNFIDAGGWEFLNFEASDSQAYEPSDVEPESESEDEEEGKTWEELEWEASSADREHGDESEERKRRKMKAFGKSRVGPSSSAPKRPKLRRSMSI